MKLTQLTKVLRSKNAGPSTVTLDLMFNDAKGYSLATTSQALTAETIATLYKVDPKSVRVVHFREALAIKVSMGRRVIAGSPGDRDVYGAQQHGPMLELEL